MDGITDIWTSLLVYRAHKLLLCHFIKNLSRLYEYQVAVMNQFEILEYNHVAHCPSLLLLLFPFYYPSLVVAFGGSPAIQEAGHSGGDEAVQGGAGVRPGGGLHGDVQQAHPEPGGPGHAGGAELGQRPGEAQPRPL